MVLTFLMNLIKSANNLCRFSFMKRVFGFVCLFLAVSLFFDVSTAFALDKREEFDGNINFNEPKYVPKEVIIKYKDKPFSRDFAFQEQKLSNKGLNVKAILRSSNILLVQIQDEQEINSVIKDLKRDPEIEIAQPNYLYQLSSIDTNDTYKDVLWGLDNTGQEVNGIIGMADADIDAPEAFDRYVGSSSVTVAVLDSGVDYTHPELVNKMWDGSNCLDYEGKYIGGCIHGYDFLEYDKDPKPTTSNHGTMIASVIAAEANNGQGILGVASNVKIMALKVDIGNIYGNVINSRYVSTFSVMEAILFASSNGAKVINASFGSTFNNDVFDYLLYSTIQLYDGLFITVAGNEGENNDGNTAFVPCSFNLPNIICVAATDSQDNLTDWSNYGNLSVDLAAPGNNIMMPKIISDPVTAYSENFESVTPINLPSGWTKSSGYNYWGTYAFSDTKVLYGDVHHMPYANNVDSYVTSPNINLSTSTGAVMSFVTRCDTEYTTDEFVDYMTLSYSPDGITFDDQINWNEVSLDEDTDEFNHGPNVLGFYQIEIPEEYLTSGFRFRFSWKTNQFVKGLEEDGCFIDDILIKKYISDSEYIFSSGTSFSAPYVTGAAALLLGHRPNASIDEIKQAIIYTGDSLASLQGKTVSGRRLNLYNALVSIDIIESFKFRVDGVDYPCSIQQELINPAKTISCSLPTDIRRTNLAPIISLSGGRIEPDSGVENNFFQNNIYTFFKSDTIVETYTVNISSYFRSFLQYRSGVGNWNVSNTKYMTSGDLTGDGKDEVVAMYDYGNGDMGLLVFRSDGTSLISSYPWYRSGVGNWNVSNTKHMTSGDFNHNLIDEIVTMYDYGNGDMGLLVFK